MNTASVLSSITVFCSLKKYLKAKNKEIELKTAFLARFTNVRFQFQLDTQLT